MRLAHSKCVWGKLKPDSKLMGIIENIVERFQPSTVLASTSGGDVRFSGALTGLLQMQGSVAGTGATLPDSSQWIDPTPGERLVLKS